MPVQLTVEKLYELIGRLYVEVALLREATQVRERPLPTLQAPPLETVHEQR
jgi:hypothetical protein